jgi:hypothetical protein
MCETVVDLHAIHVGGGGGSASIVFSIPIDSAAGRKTMCWMGMQSITPATRQSINVVMVGEAYRLVEAGQ